MDTRAEIAAFVDLGDRGAGTDAERRAAGLARDRLQSMGREATLEPIRVRPRWALAHAIATAIAVIGSVMAVSSPGAGTALVVIAVAAWMLDALGGIDVFRHLTGTRASQNVSSPERSDKPGVLMLVAHTDAPRDSAFTRLARRGDPWLAIGGSMLVVLFCCALRLFGFEGNALTAIQLLPTLLLLFATPLLVDVELSRTNRGEDDAAGASTVLSLADELSGKLEYLDVWVVLTGSQTTLGRGMRAWLRRHRSELDPRRTVVVAVETLGSGGVRYTSRAGPRLLSWRTNGDLLQLCGDIAGDDEDGEAFDAAPFAVRESGDAVAALARGLPTVAIATAEPGPVDLQAVERARGFCVELARRIDAELAPRLADEPLRPA